MIARRPTLPLSPYTTLFRSKGWHYEIFSGGDSTVLRNIKMISLGRRPERLPPGVMSKAREELRDSPLRLSDILNSRDRKSTRLNSSHVSISYAVLCLKKKNS